MATIQQQLEAIAKKRGNNGSAGDVVKKSLIRVFTSAEAKSPVDKGTFKGNWRVAFGSPDMTIKNYVEKSATNGIAVKMGTFKMGEIVIFSNPSVYGPSLEYGASNQAKSGMVRISARMWPEIVQDEIRKAR